MNLRTTHYYANKHTLQLRLEQIEADLGWESLSCALATHTLSYNSVPYHLKLSSTEEHFNIFGASNFRNKL